MIYWACLSWQNYEVQTILIFVVVEAVKKPAETGPAGAGIGYRFSMALFQLPIFLTA